MSEEFKIRNMIVLEEDLKKSIKISNDTFVIKAILPKTRKNIARSMAVQFNGYPANSYSVDDRDRIERDSTIDQSVDEGPDWWIDTNECLQDSLLDELYAAIIKWDREVQEKLKKNRFKKRVTT